VQGPVPPCRVFAEAGTTDLNAACAGIGLIVARTGYSAAFLLTAALILPALVPALRERALGTAHDHARVAGTQE
jgi:hypothetical protein